jgi:hypothetical protein
MSATWGWIRPRISSPNGLRALCKSPDRRAEDHLVVYVAAHGEILDDTGQHVLLISDVDPDDLDNALLTTELARKMLRGTSVSRLLLLLDTCYSGQGGNQLAATALIGMSRDWAQISRSGFVVVTSAQPFEQADTGAFPQLLAEAVHGLPTAGHAPEVLDLGAVVDAMNHSQHRPAFQQIGWTSVGLTGQLPAAGRPAGPGPGTPADGAAVS